MKRDVSIVIPIYIIDSDLFKMTMDVVTKIQFNTSGVNPELIIVDDCSPNQKLVCLLKERYCKNAKWIHNSINLGFAHSSNIGISNSSKDMILLLNNDVDLIDDDWLSSMIDMMEENELDVTAPNEGWLDNRHEYIPYAMRNGDSVAKFKYLVGWALLMKRYVVEEIGLLPINFGRGYWEDVLYSLILKRSGVKIGVSPIMDSGKIAHFEHKTFKKTNINLIEQYKKNQKIYNEIISGERIVRLPVIDDYKKRKKFLDIIKKEG